jgi:hypothetical protein
MAVVGVEGEGCVGNGRGKWLWTWMLMRMWMWVWGSRARGERKARGGEDGSRHSDGWSGEVCMCEGRGCVAYSCLVGQGGWIGCDADEDGDGPGSAFVSGDWSGGEGLGWCCAWICFRMLATSVSYNMELFCKLGEYLEHRNRDMQSEHAGSMAMQTR